MMKTRTLLTVVFIFSSDVFSVSSNLSLDNEAYQFLRRMETLGMIVLPSSLPLERELIAAFLIEISSGQDRLGAADRESLRRIRREFCRELTERGGADCSPSPDILYWKDNKGHNDIRLDLTLESSLQVDPQKDRTLFHGMYAPSVFGRINKSLHYHLTVDVMGDISNQNEFPEYLNPREHGILYSIPPDDRDFGNGTSNYRTMDELRGYLQFSLPWFKVMAGKDRVLWGPGRETRLFFNGRASDFEMVKLFGSFGRLRFSQIMGRMIGDERDAFKSVAAHRFEYTFYPPWISSLTLACREAVVFNGRTAELMYAIPVVPIFFAEHYLGDRDNTFTGFDITSVLRRNLKLYGELLIDDLESPQNFFSDYYGNKWAYLLGAEYLIPWYTDPEIFMEFSRIEPWVYTHFLDDGRNKFTHYGNILGADMGPDSDRWSAGIGFYPLRKLSLSVTYSRTRHGEGFVLNPDSIPSGQEHYFGAGNSVHDVHNPVIHGTRKKFLNGTIEYHDLLQLGAFYRLLDNLRIHGECAYEYTENPDNQESVTEEEVSFRAGLDFEW
ncbi:hypothetical protein ACFL5V_05855 [Fibrobacterota bacterium]